MESLAADRPLSQFPSGAERIHGRVRTADMGQAGREGTYVLPLSTGPHLPRAGACPLNPSCATHTTPDDHDHAHAHGQAVQPGGTSGR